MLGLGLGLGSVSAAALGAAGAARVRAIGFEPGRDAGTGADLFVSPAGDDGDPGTEALPKRHVQAALDAALPGQRVALRAGTYREAVTLPAGVTLARHGAERAVISGQDVLTGWAPCDAGDDALLGAARGSCWKLTRPLAAFVGGHPRGAWLHEAGAPLALATGRGGVEDHFHSDPARFLRTATPVTMADPAPLDAYWDTWFLGLSDPDVLSEYSAAQVTEMDVGFVRFPNFFGRTAVGGYDAGSHTLYFEGADPQTGYAGEAYHYHAGNSDADAYTLLNVLPRIAPGGWGWSVSGGDATLYLWPADPASLAGGITVAARGRGVRLASGCTLEGIEIEGQADARAKQDAAYPVESEGGVMTGVTLRNVAVRNCYYGSGDGFGAVHLAKTEDLVVDGLTVDGAYGTIGLALDDATRATVSHADLRRIEKTPSRLYRGDRVFYARCRAVESGVASHSNKASAYVGSDRVAYVGCDFSGASGYWTWQEASRIALVNVRAPASALDHRGIWDQNSGVAGRQSPADEDGHDGGSYLIGVEVPPNPRAPSPDSPSILLGQAQNPAVTWTVRGCVAHGLQAGWAGAVTAEDGNVCTNPNAAWQRGGDTVLAVGDVYADVETGDWRTPAGSPLHGLPALDVSAEIAAIKAWLPHVPDALFDLDLTGGVADWTARPPGARGRLTDVPPFPVQVLFLPEAAAPQVGVEIAPAPARLLGAPRPAVAYRWQGSADGTGWADIAGADALAYTPGAGDAGRLLRIVTRIDGTDHPVEMEAPVAAAGAPSFRTTGAGPYFVDPADVPAGTTRIRHRATLRVPQTVTAGLGARMLFSLPAQGFDVQMAATGAGAVVSLSKIEDDAGANLSPADRSIATLPFDTVFTVEVDGDLGAGVLRFSVDDGPVTTRALAGTGTGAFVQRELSLLAKSTGTTPIIAGVEVLALESFFTTGGTETRRVRIAGDAATVNADPWKAGDDAV